jgi:hypothetical protein
VKLRSDSGVPMVNRFEYCDVGPKIASICGCCMRVPAPSRPRHSSMTTPRSLSTSIGSSVMPPAKSLSASRPRCSALGRSVGTSSM